MDLLFPYPLGAPRPVDPATIERGLAQLWEDPTLQADAESPVVRACTLNFAVVLSADDSGQDVTDAVAALTIRHPCRAFLLTVEPQAPAPALAASVAALCHLLGGHQHICCEQVAIMAKGDAVAGLQHLLLSLLVPDLPLVVWWRGGAPLGTPLFEQLNAIADRVVIDGAASADGAVDVPRVAALLEQRRAPALTDLAWSRLTRWRTLAAQFFDAPGQRAFLDRLDRIVVEVRADVTAAEALLWLGWLASRLGWTARSGRRDPQRCVYTFDAGRAIDAEVRRYAGDAPHVLHRITLMASSAPPVRFTLERCDGDAARASAETPDLGRQSRVVPMEVRDTAALLSDELDLMGRDHMYEEALAVAGRLARLLNGARP
ncbi:MAG: glucose-6-phosphate dehydrogenase assembly protein OpcA [Candidatus Binatia bacterium]